MGDMNGSNLLEQKLNSFISEHVIFKCLLKSHEIL